MKGFIWFTLRVEIVGWERYDWWRFPGKPHMSKEAIHIFIWADDPTVHSNPNIYVPC